MTTDSPPSTATDALLTDVEVARRLGVSLRTAKEYRYSGELAYVTVGHGQLKPRKRVLESDLQAFIARRREPGRHEPRRGVA